MKEIEKQETPEVSGGRTGSCIPLPGPLGPFPLPGEGIDPYPKSPLSPFVVTDNVIEPQQQT